MRVCVCVWGGGGWGTLLRFDFFFSKLLTPRECITVMCSSSCMMLLDIDREKHFLCKVLYKVDDKQTALH